VSRPCGRAGLLTDLVGRVDVLVNNAGGVARSTSEDGLVAAAALWRANLDVNVLTAVALTQTLLFVTGQVLQVNGGALLGR
jgi:NAD(P)-dependent dehydrogenase (short-subunit alcohol dehydrogenase family)